MSEREKQEQKKRNVNLHNKTFLSMFPLQIRTFYFMYLRFLSVTFFFPFFPITFQYLLVVGFWSAYSNIVNMSEEKERM